VDAVTAKNESAALMTEDSVEALKRAIELDPNHCFARGLLGNHYYSKTYGDEFTMEPGDPYNQELANASITEFEQIIQRCPKTGRAYSARFYLAKGYYYSNQPIKALEEINILLMETPQNSEAGLIYALRANLYNSIGDIENTYDSIRKGVFYEERKNTVSSLIIGLNKVTKQNPELTQNLTPDSVSGFGRYTTAIITRDQKIHIIDELPGEHSLIYFSLERDKWIAEDTLLVKDNTYGRMDIDNQDRIHVAYASEKNIYYVRDLAKGVNSIVTIDTSQQTPFYGVSSNPDPSQLQLALSKNDKAHIVWTTPAYGLTYSTISSTGIITDPELISPSSGNASLVVSDNENVYIAYNKGGGMVFPDQQAKAWFRAKIDGVWNDPIQIGQDNIWTGGVSLAIASDQTIHLVYITGQSVEDAKLMHVSISPQGIWSNPEIIGNGSFRPWIPEVYGGKYTVAMSILKDDSLAVAWRIPDDNNGTPLVGRKLTLSGWEPISKLGFIEGSDFLESPSVVKQANPVDNIVKLIWADNGKIILFDWNP
jgi:tetratricopeptide (TPR) repeat protein